MKRTISALCSHSLQAILKKVVLAIAACSLCLATAFALSGCKPPQGQLAANAAIAEMAAIEKCDPASINYLPEVSQAAELEKIGISSQEFFGWWLSGFSYSLGDLEMNYEEDDATINAKITSRQLEPIIKQWSNEYVEWLVANAPAIKAGQTEDPCEYGKLLLQGLFESTEPTLVECAVRVHKYDDDWSVVGEPDNGLYRDALLGSTDNLAGYYAAPLNELATLGVTLPAPAAETPAEEAAPEE